MADRIEPWAQRWKSGQTGFHEGAPNALLAEHVARVERGAGAPLRVLVPLAGKTFDMRWLAERGHEVVGVEAVPEAIRAFFADAGESPAEERRGEHPAFVHGRVTLVRADMFAVTPEALGRFDLVYDRAALVAIDPRERARYVATCAALLRDATSRTFLVGMAYDQSKAPGPPWSVDEATVRELFAPRTIERLGARQIAPSPRLSASGVPTIEESAYVIGA
jgi:thiopurine S-methyltransferase